MHSKVRYLLLFSLLFLAGMRDPFQPPEDSCAVGQLARWRYQGMVSGGMETGILRDGQQRWHRVKRDERLPPGWRVSKMDQQQLTVDVGDLCEPTQWTWQREGTYKSDVKDTAVTAGAQPAPVGRRAKTRHPGGG
ncbi:HofP DNA utilization family protein [Enterobacter mori]|uniref:HofP DNA utilization family protein n=1 Tax=Enterobacter mori TaxID=539813 RepID=UPI001BFC3DAD|nr:HofP DNA utilization family protein [Enterobacter mori]QWC66708.1 DUF2531 family protein [Enterobacter mori]